MKKRAAPRSAAQFGGLGDVELEEGLFGEGAEAGEGGAAVGEVVEGGGDAGVVGEDGDGVVAGGDELEGLPAGVGVGEEEFGGGDLVVVPEGAGEAVGEDPGVGVVEFG